MNASDEPGGGSGSARGALLKALYAKYCRNEAPPQSSDEVEAELQRHLHMAELRSATLEYRLRDASDSAAAGRRAGLAENTMLLRELQVRG